MDLNKKPYHLVRMDVYPDDPSLLADDVHKDAYDEEEHQKGLR